MPYSFTHGENPQIYQNVKQLAIDKVGTNVLRVCVVIKATSKIQNRSPQTLGLPSKKTPQ